MWRREESETGRERREARERGKEWEKGKLFMYIG